MSKRFYSLKEAAAELDYHKRTIQHICHRLNWKKGPGGRWRFTDEDLDRMGRGNRK